MEDPIETAVQRNASDAMRGAVAAMADTQAAMITMLLEQGLIAPSAAQKMINELRNKKHPQPLGNAEQVRRHFMKWTADHWQDHVEWKRSSRQ